MPYLQNLFCEKCGEGHSLDVDYVKTLEAYMEDGRPSITVNSSTLIWDYLIYTCVACQSNFRYTFRDVEKSVRSYLSSLSIKYKEYLSTLDGYNKDESRRKSGEFFVTQDPDLRQRLTRLYGE